MVGLKINNTAISRYGANLLANYVITGTELDSEIFQGINRTEWTMLTQTFGMQTIKFTVIIHGYSMKDALENRSAINKLLMGKVSLCFYENDPTEDIYFTGYCVDFGKEELVGLRGKTGTLATGEAEVLEYQIKCTYTVKGMRHEALVTETATGGIIICSSTVPYTDCIVEGTPSAAGIFEMAGAVFSNVQAGDDIVFDGINKRITKNGVDYAAYTSWTRFPRLTPGTNTVTSSSGSVVVSYYPTYL